MSPVALVAIPDFKKAAKIRRRVFHAAARTYTETVEDWDRDREIVRYDTVCGLTGAKHRLLPDGYWDRPTLFADVPQDAQCKRCASKLSSSVLHNDDVDVDSMS